MPHPTLVGGDNPQVKAAGTIDIRDGKIYSVTRESGHFQPGVDSMDVVRRIFIQTLPKGVFHKNFQGFNPQLKKK